MARVTATTIKPSRKIFGEKLREYFADKPRGEKARMAAELDVDPGDLSNWIKGEIRFRCDVFDLVAEHFGITVAELLDESIELG